MSAEFGRKIKELRIKKKLTLDELADIIGSQKAYVWQLENKSPARPSGKILLELASALDVSPDFLLDDAVKEQEEHHLANALLRSVEKQGLTKDKLEQLMNIANTLGNNDSRTKNK